MPGRVAYVYVYVYVYVYFDTNSHFIGRIAQPVFYIFD
ncbi:hypothetical protein LOT_0721 [Lentilactobacillus otakiensis DSM 19908 = JCM 15040]|uniref:Uncharacterized protein n=1 Tax=Lentilactobacillus otakiensis DSM 19908 = JCM 15040 TaxID=1423780 RepID=S4NQ84_9LACO|nr:hypothetical protein LOT_0721 [Lentilactobacillus otakiensis DSM 19908 = JCM 15040]